MADIERRTRSRQAAANTTAATTEGKRQPKGPVQGYQGSETTKIDTTGGQTYNSQRNDKQTKIEGVDARGRRDGTGAEPTKHASQAKYKTRQSPSPD